MAFFDNFTKMVSEAGQKTVQKTKEFADTAKLNSQISDEERNIQNLYNQIGRMYVEKYRENPDEDFSSLISSIKASEEKIRDYRKQIQDIKGIQKCLKCGAEVPAGAAFCNNCGSPMTKPEPAADPVPQPTVKCPNCGEEMLEGTNFCVKCGSPLSKENSEDEKTKAGLKCPKCGADLAEGTNFCVVCGTPLGNPESPVSEETEYPNTPEETPLDETGAVEAVECKEESGEV